MSVLGGVAVASTFECKIHNLSGSTYETKYFETRAEAEAWGRTKVRDLDTSSIFSKYGFTVEINTSSAQPTPKAQGLEAERLEEDLRTAETFLRIYKTEADRDPYNVNRQRDVSAGYRLVGSALKAQGKLPEALDYYQKSLAIMERLAGQDRSRVSFQQDLSASYEGVGDVLRSQGKVEEASKAFQQAKNILVDVQKRAPLSTSQQESVDRIEKELSTLKGEAPPGAGQR